MAVTPETRVAGPTRGLAGDFGRAIAQALDKRFLGVLLMSVGASLALLFGLAGVLGWLVSFLPETITLPLIGWEIDTPFTGLQGLAVLGVMLASVFLMIPVAVVFVNLLIERIVDAVEARWYGGPARGAGRGVGDQIGAALRMLVVVLLANLVLLFVAILAGPLAPVLFIAVNGYLLGREFFETVAQRMMRARDARALRRRHRVQVWIGGVMMTVPLVVPIMNLVVPVIGVAAFTHMVHRLAERAP
ncbi:MAG: EI24 domain-containing protein [Pseudomonadota bacterium]